MKTNFRTGFAVIILTLLAVSFSLISTGCNGQKSASNPSSTPTAGISVSTRQLASGNVILDNTVDQPVTIQNSGSARLAIGSIAQADPLATPFQIVNDNCSDQSLPASGSCTFKVRFLPTSEGSFNDTFDIPSNAFNEKSVIVSVSGAGKALKVIINQVKTDSCGSNNELELLVSVMDRFNHPVAGLGTANFQFSENNVAQTISSLSPSAISASLSVAEVLDYSASLDSQIATMEDASGYFIGLMTEGDEAAIFKFSQSGQLMQDFTTDKTLLTTAATTYPANIGSRLETRLNDALWSAIDLTATRQNNRVIILISDGIDEDANNVPNASVKSLAEVIAHAVDKNVAIFAVGLGNSNGVVMNQLAGGTGGQYYYAPSASQLYDIYDAIRDLVSGQYSMKYTSSLHGSGSILFNVTVNSNGQGEVSRQAPGCP
jgi:VWFA-related protein